MIIELGLIISIIFGITGWAIAYYQHIKNRNTDENVQLILKTIKECLKPLTKEKLKNIRSKGLKNILDEISQKADLKKYSFIYKDNFINEINFNEVKITDDSSWKWIGYFKYLTIGDFSNVEAYVIIDPKSVSISIDQFEFPYKYNDVKPEELSKKIISQLKLKYEEIATDIRIEFKEKRHEEEND